ncbi:MAG: pseudouridine synthase, partial [Myxococcota bacterium]
TFSRARLNAPLGRDEARGRIIVTSAGKPALSLVRVRARRDGFALVEVRLETGRTHQVRVHLAHAGHPLVGESVYRVPPSDRHPRQALHAFELCVADGPRLRAPLPQDLLTLLAELGLRDAADINDGN